MFPSSKYLLAMCLLMSVAGLCASAKQHVSAEDPLARKGERQSKVGDPEQRRAALRAALKSQSEPQKQGQEPKSSRQLSQDERIALRRELQQQRAEALTKPVESHKP